MSVNDRARTMLYPDTQLHDRPAHGEAERVAPPTAEDIDRDITAARRVLALEASGINALARPASTTRFPGQSRSCIAARAAWSFPAWAKAA